MVLQHNLSAINNKRLVGIIADKEAKRAEKLSSGYRINRVADVDIGTQKGATDAILVIGNAVHQISSQQSRLRAYQNRLEHTVYNLENAVENTTAAESRIRDTNMAREMVEWSNLRIIGQTGQAMLAQSNQNNQGILALLG